MGRDRWGNPWYDRDHHVGAEYTIMEWVILFGILVVVLMVIYGRLREELNNNKTKQLDALKAQVKEQNELARKKDEEFLSTADADSVVGFLNRLRKDD